jgi:hypothetical protein
MPDCHHEGQHCTTMGLLTSDCLAIADGAAQSGLTVHTFLWENIFLSSPNYCIKVNEHKKGNWGYFVEFKN